MEIDPIQTNPFYILDLSPTASRAEVERQGQKLLGMLEIGVKQATTYLTPLGRFPRDADQVRQALAELRDPKRRLTHELWAALPADTPSIAEEAPSLGSPTPWQGALKALGWSSDR